MASSRAAETMRTLRLTLAYDGTDFAGWQVQRPPRGPEKPTVQGVLEQTLQRILQQPVTVVGSGRTDAGVHALAQVAHVRVHTNLECTRLQHALNELLPASITVTALDDVPSAFHARFAAQKKRYRYRVSLGPPLPFERRYVYAIPYTPKQAPMRRAAAQLLGEHDFRAFARSSPRSTVRTVFALSIRRRDRELWFEIEGNGFLHMMVRSIVGTLLDIGRGHKPEAVIAQMLATGNRALAGPTVPAGGLCLVSVEYEQRFQPRSKP